MTGPLPSSERAVERKVKFRAHRKSRQGCGNCKLRKVKCDERKPRCKRCTTFGVFCNYEGDEYSDLQLQLSSAGDSGAFFKTDILQQSQNFSCSSLLDQQTIPIPIAPSLIQQSRQNLQNSGALYQLREQDFELLSKFQARTVVTISTHKSRSIYENAIMKLVFSHPFLMHAVLMLTLLHDRYLSGTPNTTTLTTTEAFHWYQSISLFNRKLSGGGRGPPIIHTASSEEGDALWATVILFATIAFCDVDANGPEEAWPLKPPSSLDLNWMTMSQGKREIWKLVDPLRDDSSFRPIALENISFLPTASVEPRLLLETLPSELIMLCGLDTAAGSNTENNNNNPYYAAACTLATSLSLESTAAPVIVNFLSFISHMQADYKQLLERKDPAALLLLAYWYAKICQYRIWWLWRRAALECQAICLYLERYHSYDPCIQNLLRYPRMIYGAVASES